MRIERVFPVDAELPFGHAENAFQDQRQRTAAIRAADAMEVDRIVVGIREHAEILRHDLFAFFRENAVVGVGGMMDELHRRSQRRNGHVRRFAGAAQIKIRLDVQRVEHPVDIRRRQAVTAGLPTVFAVVVEPLTAEKHVLLDAASVHRLPATQITRVADAAFQLDPAGRHVLRRERRHGGRHVLLVLLACHFPVVLLADHEVRQIVRRRDGRPFILSKINVLRIFERLVVGECHGKRADLAIRACPFERDGNRFAPLRRWRAIIPLLFRQLVVFLHDVGAFFMRVVLHDLLLLGLQQHERARNFLRNDLPHQHSRQSQQCKQTLFHSAFPLFILVSIEKSLKI